MSLYTTAEAALQEADFMAAHLNQRVYIIDRGADGFGVSRSYTAAENILEIVKPIQLETLTV